MCGIVGYIGNKNASNILIKGLQKLEYRGYDSVGVAIMSNSKIALKKTKGRVKVLNDILEKEPIEGNIGIGHTRWATHGIPSDINSHPHMDCFNEFAVVHNGIIENYTELKQKLISNGYTFKSATDTEVIPNLIKYYYKGDFLKAVVDATSELKGSFAICVLSNNNPDTMIAVRKESPMVIGKANDGFYIASDIPAILSNTRDIYMLNNYEYTLMENGTIKFYDENLNEIKKETKIIEWDISSAEKCGYDDFMLKEIFEQPKAFKDTLSSRLSLDSKITLDDIELSKEYINSLSKIYIIACGTAMHAGLIGKKIIETLTSINVEVDMASEFRYRNPLLNENTLVITVSQSGETADTLAAIKLAKSKNAKTFAVCNVVGSSIARESDYVFYTYAGPEIAVASTKAYTAQLAAMYILGLYFAQIKESKSEKELNAIKNELLEIPNKMQEILDNIEPIKTIAKENYLQKDIFFLGRGIDYSAVMEASLKLKEITYIHSDAYAAGELKHGPIALIEDGTLVVTSINDESLMKKTISNIIEVVTRGANIFAVTSEDLSEYNFKYLYKIPKTLPILSPTLSIIPLQVLAYYICKEKGLDVDKPRNLAKSVTVE